MTLWWKLKSSKSSKPFCKNTQFCPFLSPTWGFFGNVLCRTWDVPFILHSEKSLHELNIWSKCEVRTPSRSGFMLIFCFGRFWGWQTWMEPEARKTKYAFLKVQLAWFWPKLALYFILRCHKRFWKKIKILNFALPSDPKVPFSRGLMVITTTTVAMHQPNWWHRKKIL